MDDNMKRKILTVLSFLFLMSASLYAQSGVLPLDSGETQTLKTEHSENANNVSSQSQIGLLSAISNGTIFLNNRFRTEIVAATSVENAYAHTNRLQLGYGTLPWYGFSGFADFVDVRPIGPERYNAAGLNNEPGRAVVADPRLTVLNQLYGQFQEENYDFLLRIGRQRIIHQNARFIGNVGWRQNEQTFDAITTNTSLGMDDLKLQYSYVWQVNRIFGPEHPQGIFESNSHLAHLTYSNIIPGSTLTAFFYNLDFEEAAVLSSNTIGFRLNGDFGVSSDFSLHYAGSLASQQEAGDNPNDYSAMYYMMDLSVSKTNLGKVGLMYEVQESDDGTPFRTPLATLHAFQGWADLFLATPSGGLEDLNVHVNGQLPWGISGTLKHHWFYGNESGQLLGRELDFSLGKKINDNLNFLVKFADFNGMNSSPDVRKFWMQLNFNFN